MTDSDSGAGSVLPEAETRLGGVPITFRGSFPESELAAFRDAADRWSRVAAAPSLIVDGETIEDMVVVRTDRHSNGSPLRFPRSTRIPRATLAQWVRADVLVYNLARELGHVLGTLDDDD